MPNAIQFNEIMMDSTAQLLSSTTSLSDAQHDSFIEIAKKHRRTRTQRNAATGLNQQISPIQSPNTTTEPRIHRIHNRPYEPMGKRDPSTCLPGERIERTSNEQKEIYNRKEHNQGTRPEDYGNTQQPPEFVWQIDKIQ